MYIQGLILKFCRAVLIDSQLCFAVFREFCICLLRSVSFWPIETPVVCGVVHGPDHVATCIGADLRLHIG